MQIALLATMSLILYVYVIYPFLLFLLYRFRIERKGCGDERFIPSVSIIIPVHNEAKLIQKKMDNTITLDYPKEKLEILVGSDGSTDETEQLLHKWHLFFPFVKISCFPSQRGKAEVINELVTNAKGEIIVLTDADVILQPDAVKKIVRNFAGVADKATSLMR